MVAWGLEVLELGHDERDVHALDVTEGGVEPVPECEGLTTRPTN
jgi:hypothetical protein